MTDTSSIIMDSDQIVHYEPWTIASGRTVRRKKRKIREGSQTLSVENLSPKGDSSSDMEPHTVFQTPTRNTQPPDLKLFITPINREKTLRNTSLVTIAKAIKNCCGTAPDFIKSTRTGILVQCINTKQLKLLNEIQTIGNIHVKVQDKLNVQKGVISGVPIEMTEEEIQMELRNQKVVNVKRIVKKTQKRNEATNIQETYPTRSVIISFSGNKSLPKDIILCYQKKQVNNFIPPIRRCFNCQRFGHTISNCHERIRCVRCGDAHTFEECTKKETPKCINCGGKHSAAFNGCEEAKKAKAVQRIKIENNLNYAQAVQKWNGIQNNQAPTNSAQPPHPTPQPRKINATLNQLSNKLSVQAQVHQNPSLNFSQEFPPTQPIVTPIPNATSHTNPRHTQPNGKNERTSQTQKGHFLTTATNEQLITFIVQLLMNFVKEQSETEVLDFIKTTTERLLIIKETKAS